MPELSQLWQRFLLAASLVIGLLIGIGATVFGYSNLGTVNVKWSVFELDGIPLWTVAVIPVTVVIVAGTLYHWFNGFHHFTEHMRHRRRVHELEAEIAKLRGHLDDVLEMPAQTPSSVLAKPPDTESVTASPALLESGVPGRATIPTQASAEAKPSKPHPKRRTAGPAPAQPDPLAETASPEPEPVVAGVAV